MSKKLIFPHGFPQRGEIYLVDFNRRKGREIRKIRPALVLSNNVQNEHDIFLTMAPLTSDEMEITRPFEIVVNGSGLDKPSKILLNQIHSVDKEARLREYLGQVEDKVVLAVNKALKLVLALE